MAASSSVATCFDPRLAFGQNLRDVPTLLKPIVEGDVLSRAASRAWRNLYRTDVLPAPVLRQCVAKLEAIPDVDLDVAARAIGQINEDTSEVLLEALDTRARSKNPKDIRAAVLIMSAVIRNPDLWKRAGPLITKISADPSASESVRACSFAALWLADRQNGELNEQIQRYFVFPEDGSNVAPAWPMLQLFLVSGQVSNLNDDMVKRIVAAFGYSRNRNMWAVSYEEERMLLSAVFCLGSRAKEALPTVKRLEGSYEHRIEMQILYCFVISRVEQNEIAGPPANKRLQELLCRYADGRRREPYFIGLLQEAGPYIADARSCTELERILESSDANNELFVGTTLLLATFGPNARHALGGLYALLEGGKCTVDHSLLIVDCLSSIVGMHDISDLERLATIQRSESVRGQLSALIGQLEGQSRP